MKKLISCLIVLATSCATHSPNETKDLPDWVKASNELATEFTRDMANIAPEIGSSLGYAEYDSKAGLIDNNTDAETLVILQKWSGRLEQMLNQDLHPDLLLDAKILKTTVDNWIEGIRLADSEREIGFVPGTKMVFAQIQSLMTPQVPEARKKAVVDRFKAYVTGSTNKKPILFAHRDLVLHRLNKFKGQKTFLPYRGEVEEYLKDSASYTKGLAEVLTASGRTDWSSEFEIYKIQADEYDEFIRKTILPISRKDPRQPRSFYILKLKANGITATPEELISMGEAGLRELSVEFNRLGKVLAAKYKLKNSDPASVIWKLPVKLTATPEEVEQLYKSADRRLESIIKENHIVSLPGEPLRIRLAGEAESLMSPAPHVSLPALVNNKGERPEFVVPTASKKMPYLDFANPYGAMALTSHEGRPGHDLQMRAILDRDLPLIRAIYAFNSSNVEGWGLYAEDLVIPFLSDEEKLFAYKMRALRIARSILDPKLQLGLISKEKAIDFLVKKTGTSKEFATFDVRRYIYDNPGQAPSYYYGYLKMKNLRNEMETSLGPRFELKDFHDRVLNFGMMPLDLLGEKVRSSYQ